MDVVEAGIDRQAFSADCLNVLIKELCLNAQENHCKVALVIDGVNPLFNHNTYVCKDWDKAKMRMKSYKVRQRLCTVNELSVMNVLIKVICGGFGGKNILIVTSVGKDEEIHTDGNYRDVINWWREQEVDMRPVDLNINPFEMLGEFGWSEAFGDLRDRTEDERGASVLAVATADGGAPAKAVVVDIAARSVRWTSD